MSEPSEKPPIETIPDEMLVAFLDGELNDAQRAMIQARLEADEALRARCEQLDGTWRLLDELPRDDPNKTRAETALQTVAMAALGDLQREESRRRRLKPIVLTALVPLVLIAAWLGYWLTYRHEDRENRKLIQNWEVIENIDQYRYADDIEFLRALNASGLFDAQEEEVPIDEEP